MNNTNSVVLVGRLTRDSELRVANTGFPILQFSVANNYSKKVGEEWKDEANFFDCVVFGKRAEWLKQHLTKGVAVTVGGALRQERWESDGQKRSKIVIVADTVDFFNTQASSSKSVDDYNEDIPF